jgi:uncharacterized protein (DUF2147 family)
MDTFAQQAHAAGKAPLGKVKPSKADAILGTYYTPAKEGKIQIYKYKGKYYGRIIGGKFPSGFDVKNEKAELRKRKLLGLNLLADLEFDNEKEWINGHVYDPEEGKTYKCKAWRYGSHLKVRGYIGNPYLGRTKVFMRCR